MADFLRISDKAVEKALKFIAEQAKEENTPIEKYCLRIYVEGGGCAGFQYGLSIDKVKNETDTIVKKGNLEVVVDAMSAMYLQGSEIDFVDGLYGSGFKIINPNASGSCGCGHSFSF